MINPYEKPVLPEVVHLGRRKSDETVLEVVGPGCEFTVVTGDNETRRASAAAPTCEGVLSTLPGRDPGNTRDYN